MVGGAHPHYESLDFADHWATHARLHSSSNPETAVYFYKRAQSQHAYVVQGAVLSCVSRGHSLAAKLKQKKAINLTRFAFGRRIIILHENLRQILFLAHPERDATLNSSEQSQLSSHINSIYIHLLGCLDNIAMILYHEFDYSLNLRDRDISLFKIYKKMDPRKQKFYESISFLQEWFVRDLKPRRNPVAHRFPLYAIPSVLLPADLPHFEQIQLEYNKAFSEMKLEKAQRLLEDIEKLGKFIPAFTDGIEVDFTPIYPTIPNDVANFLKIFRAFDAVLENQALPA